MAKYKTSESVCKGHPDKLCDLIADSILDACLRKDKSSRVACEVMATKGKIIVAGEITCSKKVDIRWVVRRVLEDVGYNPWKFMVFVFVHQQSKDIAGGVDRAMESRAGDTSWYSMLGAGDQGTVYGYATDETAEKLPLPLVYAHAICRKLDSTMKNGVIKGIGPDGKAQVTVEYEDDKPKRIKTIIVSVQHRADKELEVLRSEIISQVLWPVFEKFPFDDDTEILVNPSGRFVEGGPAADTGLTGRKIMVDSYGGLAAHGGGAFSGKDPTKVDRSGAYMARAIAKNIVRCDYAKRCQIAISYAIGKADPVAVEIDTLGTGTVPDEILHKAVLDVFNLRPAAIIETLSLRDAIYADTATYGHFSGTLSRWEWLDRYKELREAVKKYAD
ncbi:S-adenosylmethionine synthetase [Desulfosporosinus sp. Tol-M]|nr:S-adenosylmethionine synthetase [Desulfosporosinus sp. Tol-M]